MAHMIETMAYAGAVPWHGLGNAVSPNLLPEEILKEAELDWTVEKAQLQTIDGIKIPDKYALIRSTDRKPFGVCTGKYIPSQNSDTFSFFDKFVKAGRMTMETAGALDGGARVWALARMNQGDFALANDDKVESFLLLCSPHVPGKSLTIMHTPIRVVCHNTLTMALAGADKSEAGEGLFKMRHTQFFGQEIQKQAEIALGLSAEQMQTYRESAEFLTSKRITDDSLNQYFTDLFKKSENVDMQRTLDKLNDAYARQPGFDKSPNTWWTAFNAVTFHIDHIAGLNQNNRIRNAWFGQAAGVKRRALSLAIDMARAA